MPERRTAYHPYKPARRPGARPSSAPRFRLLVHRDHLDRWRQLVERVGQQSAQQFYDYVTATPGAPPSINSTTVLRGRAGRPIADGFSRTVHYEVSAQARIDYQYNDRFSGGAQGDEHPVVYILAITFASH